MRGRPTSSTDNFEPDSSLLTLLEDESAGGQSTVRPPPISNVPATLRNLFDYGDPPPEPFRMPTFETPSEDPLTTNPSLNVSTTPARGRSPSRGLTTPEPSLGEDLRTAKQSSFVFPPKAALTPRSKSSGGEQDENEPPPISPVERKRERLPPLGPGIPRMLAPAPALAEGDEKSSVPPFIKPVTTYREVRPNRGMPDIEIPQPSPISSAVDSPPIVLSSSSPEQSTARLPPMNRKRSQSTVAASSAPSTSRERSLATPDFRFPPVAPSPLNVDRDAATASPTPTFRLIHGHDRRSPTHSSISTVSTISTSSIHQTSHSLDVSILPIRLASPGGSLPTPPPIMRARSATATTESSLFAAAQSSIMNMIPKTPSRRPSLNRLASAPALDLPIRPFARSQDRSGSPAESSFSTSSGMPLPGLRDVLKVAHVARLKCAFPDCYP